VFDENPYRFSPLAPDTSFSDVLPSLRIGARLSALPWLMIKGNLGRSHRSPSFFELFGDRGGVLGNTGLRAERGFTWDIGFRAGTEVNAGTLEAVYFDHNYTDLIQFMQFSQGVGRAQNIGSARSRGVETTVRLRPVAAVTLSGNYTFQRAVDESEVPHQKGKILPNRPQHEAHMRGGIELRRVRAYYEYAFEDGNFLDRANLRPVQARHIQGCGLKVGLGHGIELTLEAKNVTDNQVADLWGYPLPGRSYFATLKSNSR
jgi:iron complex outermembrane receptor protein